MVKALNPSNLLYHYMIIIIYNIIGNSVITSCGLMLTLDWLVCLTTTPNVRHKQHADTSGVPLCNNLMILLLQSCFPTFLSVLLLTVVNHRSFNSEYKFGSYLPIFHPAKSLLQYFDSVVDTNFMSPHINTVLLQFF